MFHILHAITLENSQGVSIITCLCIKLFDFICLILIKNSELSNVVYICHTLCQYLLRCLKNSSVLNHSTKQHIFRFICGHLKKCDFILEFYLLV